MPGFRGALLAGAAVGLLSTPAAAKNAVTAEPPPQAEDRAAPRVHVVVSGDSLWNIARQYDCMPEDLKRVNKIRSNTIYPGNRLTIPRCDDAAPAADAEPEAKVKPKSKVARELTGMLSHEVKSGDTLFAIAQKYDTTVDDLKLRNGISSNLIMPGQQLDVVPGSGKSGRAIKGQSIGRTHRGRLVAPTRLTGGKGYFIRRPNRAFGANHVVFNVKRAVNVVRRRHPKVHTLAIGDISAKKGGKITQHRSHQSGRDVDVGLYFKKKPKSYPKSFVKATSSNLDFGATWTLVSTFAGMADADNGVEVIFLDYGVQKMLYKWARKQGVSNKTLGKMFQYPDGRGSATGLIRHEPGHADHLHVRFKCPKGDKDCL